MKSLLKYAGITGFVITILALTACGGQPSFDVTLDNGRELAVETDHLSLTNQEMFELVAGGYVNGVNPGVLTILDWADMIILSDLFEVDEELVDGEVDMLLDWFDEDELEELLLLDGFASIEEYRVAVRLNLLRRQAAEDAVDIDPERVNEIYENYFATTDEELDEVDNDRPTTEDVLSDIEESLRSEALQEEGFSEGVLARLRAEHGLTIYSDYFVARYESFLALQIIDDVDVATGNNNNAVASINGSYLTTDELFDDVINRFALGGQQPPLLTHIDLNVLNEIYDVSDNVIREEITQAKINMQAWFYPQMELMGLLTERQIFNHFLTGHLQDLAFNEAFLPISDERIQELYEEHIEWLTLDFEAESTPERSARHILIPEDDTRTLDEAREFAEGLIAQLQEVDADEVEDLFIELAEAYSTCPSAANGGSLGSFPHSGPRSMVQPFADVTFALEIGEFTTEPVLTEFGYHVIYLYDIEELEDEGELELPTLQEIRSDLIEHELQRLRNSPHYFANVMFDLRAQQNIRFHHEGLQIQYDIMIDQTRRHFED